MAEWKQNLRDAHVYVIVTAEMPLYSLGEIEKAIEVHKITSNPVRWNALEASVGRVAERSKRSVAGRQ